MVKDIPGVFSGTVEVDEAYPYEFNQYLHERHVFFTALVNFYEADKAQGAAAGENFLTGIKKSERFFRRIR